MKKILPNDACNMMLNYCEPALGSEILPIDSCLGRVLAQNLLSLVAHPPRRISAMDGYAVRTSQASKGEYLHVVGISPAGAENVPKLCDGKHAVQIFTGGALPQQADAILIDEKCSSINVENNGDRIRVLEKPKVGQYIRARGADFLEDECLLQKNKLLSVRDITLAATMNHAWLNVRRKPVVAIIASGDELAQPGEARGDKEIAAANSLMLSLLIKNFGANARIVPFAKDSLVSLKDAFLNALQGADLLVASGGASKSNADWIDEVIKELKIKEIFSELAMRPGKPTRFALAERIPILVLPGNPASVYVGAMVFLQPMIRKMLSLTHSIPQQQYPLASAIDKGGARSHYMRAWIRNGEVKIFNDQESAHTLTLARANCLALQPAFAPAKKKGESIEVLEINALN